MTAFKTPTTAHRCQPTKLELRSLEIWEEARQALAAVAGRKGWPCRTDADLDKVIDRLDAESGDERPWFWIDFQSALLMKANVEFGFMDWEELDDVNRVIQDFLKRLESQ